MKRKITKAELEEENKWLWYNEMIPEDDAMFIEITQYNKKGEVVSMAKSKKQQFKKGSWIKKVWLEEAHPPSKHGSNHRKGAKKKRDAKKLRRNR